MSKIPFYLGNLVACFVPGSKNRAHCRASINLFLYYPKIAGFIKKTFGEQVHSVKFIRQRTLNRVVCLVNDKYYVKIFRDVTNARLRDFEFIANYIRPFVGVTIPRVVVDAHAPMYVCEKIAGRPIEDFDHDTVIQNEKKIQAQVFKIIDELQSIDVDAIPDNARFNDSLQTRTVEAPTDTPRRVLAHFDLNETNLFFDDDLNVCAVIDWDTLSIANNPDTDRRIFMKYWNRYKNQK